MKRRRNVCLFGLSGDPPSGQGAPNRRFFLVFAFKFGEDSVSIILNH